MRILFDSKKSIHKTPFGCVTAGSACTLRIFIPASVETGAVSCVLQEEDGTPKEQIPFSFEKREGAYDIWRGEFTLCEPALLFYYFRITGKTGTFRLFKQGDDTNMEAGDLWQITCVSPDFTTPDWAKGAVIYQVFPDRFRAAGKNDLTGKLTPYVCHRHWDEEVFWQPEKDGTVRNNDFYGGNFQGITEKLPYIAAMGATILYLNPISKSFSSHRYDTGDYKTPDPMLGTEKDFSVLCETAHALGIRVILDGVYSHTGADSLYFNKYGHFDGVGAYQSPDSPYYSWYTFCQYPDTYNSWWGFDTLPTVNKTDPAFLAYIIEDADSVLAHWLNLGADGFRLDVADELPNAFLAALKRRVRQIKPDALVIGEVWEDASNKIAYDVRRRYFTDGTLDSVMNYPFRNAILAFLKGSDGGESFRQTVLTILENYPRQVVHCNMNLLGSHDTPRILTALVDDFDGPREALAQRSLSPQQRYLARQRLYMASFLQYTLPGSPSIYYGDEAGMEGGKDPFNRRTYPWGREDSHLLAHYAALGNLRKKVPALRTGNITFFRSAEGVLEYTRESDDQRLRIYVNRSDAPLPVPEGTVLYSRELTQTGKDRTLLPMGMCLIREK